MECKHVEFDGGGYCVDCKRNVYSSLRFEQAENQRLREALQELQGVVGYNSPAHHVINDALLGEEIEK